MRFSLFQNDTVRCGADYIFQESYGAVAVPLSVEQLLPVYGAVEHAA